MKFITILAIALAASTVSAANWAVIVAGSNGYWNYRHQADTCHAYQIVLKGGIPAANIIHFAYDDVANNSQNPFPGKLFNKPNGSDVYGGCVIDYKGDDVTPKKYLAVLRGDSTAAGGKVLKSTSDDDVFLNFADHGAPGLIAFPSQYLYAKDLTATLQGLFKANGYKNLVYYLEACESGSMFENIPTDWNLFAVTAANDHESSWGTYCSPDDVVQGKHIGSCLGDLFSVNWMENTDSIDTSTTTVGTQVDAVVKATDKSHVMQYGTTDLRKLFVSAFVGPQKPSTDSNAAKSRVIDSRDIKLHYLINKHANELSEESMSALNEEILSRKTFDDIFANIRVHHENVAMAKDTDFDCYKNIINYFEATCGKFSEYGMKYMRSFYDVCQNKQDAIPAIKATIMDSCPEGKLF